MFHVEHKAVKQSGVEFIVHDGSGLNTVSSCSMSSQHSASLALAWETLEGLSVGDAFGEALSYQHTHARDFERRSQLKAGTLRFTDDTAMALGIFECFAMLKTIDQDALAWIFAKNLKADPERGYGKMTRRLLTEISHGGAWRPISASAFGRGSFGNGSAMRVAPLGAYFSEDLERVRAAASASAQVTHFHPEATAGAIAVAIAAAEAVNHRTLAPEMAASHIWHSVLNLTPDGATAKALGLANSFNFASKPAEVAKAVGCGYEVSCQDTVPFAIWNACRCIHNFPEALFSTVEVGGDCDTNAAIVCSIVAAYGTAACIPEPWRIVREPLPKRTQQ